MSGRTRAPVVRRGFCIFNLPPGRGARVRTLAVALLLMAGLLAACTVTSCGRSSPWDFQTVEGDSSLLSVSAADPSHVWVVGGGPVYFFDGVSWNTQVQSLETEPLDVSAADPTHIWACGGDGKGVVFASDGKTWNKQFETGDKSMGVIAAADPSQVWAAATNQADTGTNIYFFNGASWSLQYSADIHVQDMSAVDARHAWAVAEDRQGKSAVYFFDGSAWSRSFVPAEGEALFGIAAADPSDAWAVGSAPASGGGSAHVGGSIFHFDGSTWKKQYETAEELHKVTAPDASHAWATGGIGTTGPIYYFGGSYWSRQFSGKEPLFDISAPDSGHAWAVGGLGSIFTYEPAGP